MKTKALVLLSGGQDSTTCLYWAMDRFGAGAVEAITFDYGQRHRAELECAATVAESAGITTHMFSIGTFAELGGNALTDGRLEVATGYDPGNATSGTVERLPNTFVPGRNIVFLTFAAAYAWQNDIGHLVTGVAQTDYSGYPDCRRETIEALQSTLRLGMQSQVEIHTPLMSLSKKDTVLLARDLGALDAMAFTHSCYNGMRPPCGDCPACRLRARGFAEAGIDDPLLAAAT
jgi:7-cyano-7-deazaguanine synthase